MKKYSYFLVLSLFLMSWQSVAEPLDVIICGDCTSANQFEWAAIAGTGTPIPGTTNYLVINPQTGDSRSVMVMYTPPGWDPMGTTTMQPLPQSGLVSLGHSSHPVIFVSGIDTNREIALSGASAVSSPVSAEASVEIGALIEFGSSDFVVVLPDNDLFGSFSGRNEPAVANHIYQAMTANNPGWATKTISNRVRKLIQQRISMFFGRPFQVCAIFNNGDSACMEPDAATPSLENLIEGTAKNKYGNPIGSGGGAGGGGGLEVDYAPPTLSFGWTGSTGSSGEVWLFCATEAGVLIGCWIEVL